MSHLSSAAVKRGPQKTCFVNLSSDLARVVAPRSQNLPQTLVLQLEWPDKTAFVSWSGEVAVNRNKGFIEASSSVIEIGTKFADSLGLEEGQQILVSPVESALSCTRMSVDPVSADDWEILELHAGYVESQLLNQVRIVCPSEVLPVWIKKNLCIWVKVVSIEPTASCVKLEEFTEVIISPRLRFTENPSSESRKKSSSDVVIGQTARGTSSDPTDSVNDDNVSSLHSTTFHASDERTSITSMAYSYLRTLFYGRDLENAPQSERQTPATEPAMVNSDASNSSSTPSTSGASAFDSLANIIEREDIDLCVRTQYTNSNSKSNGPRYCICQPSTVFVNVASLPEKILKSWHECVTFFPLKDNFIVKIVQIQRLLSPREQAEQTSSRNKGSTSMPEENGGATTQPVPGENRNPSSQSSSSQSAEENLALRSVVRLVITNGLQRTRRLCPSCTEEQVLSGHIVMSKELSEQLGVQCPSLVRLKSVYYPVSNIQGLVLQPLESCSHKVRDMDFGKVVQAFQDWLCSVSTDDCPLVATDDMLIVFPVEGDSLEFLLSVLSHQVKSSDAKETLPYHYLGPQTLKTVTVVLGNPGVLSQAVIQSKSGSNPKCCIDELGGLKDAFKKCEAHLLIALGQQPLTKQIAGEACSGLRSGALLICGSGTGSGIGCGKTSLAHALCHQLQRWPTCAHVRIVDCVPLRGKRVETIHKHLQEVFTDGAWHEPAVILLDDLDQVISAPSPSQEIGGEALYKTRLAEVFKDLIANEVNNMSKVAVIATSRSRESLHPSLLTSHGSHVFQCRIELPPPDSGQRQEILSLIVKKRFPGMNTSEADLSALMKRTEGFSPRDLNALTDRAIHMMTVKQMRASQGRTSPSTEISLDDFETALKDFKPAALRGVNLHTAGDLGWSDVGGLAEVKNVLKETLLWPSKYSSLFNKCPLRLRSGILLYGPPGTGKTLLAGVVAKECGLNFISIKGPELLSKYIGASEQAVRDMFTRAQSAKPCVLFFDEFDSLAPRRGHDSTGVTDRVVNQLLTQLDGVEGLERVYVLAATSRPDLIDPALLRPGRLDKCLYCGIPSKVERGQILCALSRNLLLDGDVNLESVAETCEDFTGADLKALLYNAQLEAIHRSTSASQLYGNVFTRAVIPDQREDSNAVEDEERSVLPTTASKGIIYIPSLQKGQKKLSLDEETTLKAELAVIEENLQDGRRRRQQYSEEKQLSNAEAGKTHDSGRVRIKQSDFVVAAGGMGPSVSKGEQLKYQRIYESFVNSRGGAFSQSSPGQGRATLS